ncbi:hypothetical protein CAPTEDRAFT_216107 [Capitella teleta]|uniref:G-protein coupled receptors family 1 profile domain-containing protein n=1 Tax=Capitella teleta TaxID=283909 RepID=R7TV15_CAPTE|nr:hypothetical protein CAPTEDRAFT_216107 [Capitella teleta]|eukprot:ELT97564.1 hypothetical protein CAPTEDRAFT_216107 [Capitella teleta]
MANLTSTANLSSLNSSLEPPTHNDSFFDTYYSVPRFWLETVFASVAALCNICVLLAVKHSKGRRSIYNTLFVNLAVANILSCLLSWLCNNLLVLFSRRILLSGTSVCTALVYMTAAAFVSNAFGLVSTLTMLGFSAVQYFAVCHPLHNLSIIRPRRVRAFIIIAWTFSLAAGCLPWAVLLGMSWNIECGVSFTDILTHVLSVGCNTCIGVVSVVYVAAVVLCVRIYAEIRSVHQCIMRYRQERDIRGERRAFVTIIILLTTLTIFYIPFNVAYLVSVNSDGGVAMEKSALIIYMNIMPYCKFISDPLIYGLRMREVKEGCLHILVKLGFKSCLKIDVKPSPRNTSFTLTRINSSFSTRKNSTPL